MKEMPVVNNPVVYYLLRNDKIVYIGLSHKNFHERINNHLKDKIFDKVIYQSCEIEKLRDIEASEIRTHKPEYNKKLYFIKEKVVKEVLRKQEKPPKQIKPKKEKISKRKYQKNSPERAAFKQIVYSYRDELIKVFTIETVDIWLAGRQNPSTASVKKVKEIISGKLDLKVRDLI